MALQREIWIKAIIEGLFANNTFAARSTDHSEFVNDRMVHVPNAGAPSNIELNRTVFPASVTTRQDNDLTYTMDEYTVDPVRVPHAETVELSYPKRESIIRQNRNGLTDRVHRDIIYRWIPDTPTIILTEGADEATHLTGTNGTRKMFTKKTVQKTMNCFDSQDIPEEGRCFLLDAIMYNQLLFSMTDAEVAHFLACADPAKGTIGEYLGFHFYKRSTVARTKGDETVKPWTAAADADDCAAALAWHEDCVSRALGEAVMFDDQDNPVYYGDIMSFLQRAGGKWLRADKKGIALIKQGA